MLSINKLKAQISGNTSPVSKSPKTGKSHLTLTDGSNILNFKDNLKTGIQLSKDGPTFIQINLDTATTEEKQDAIKTVLTSLEIDTTENKPLGTYLEQFATEIRTETNLPLITKQKILILHQLLSATRKSMSNKDTFNKVILGVDYERKNRYSYDDSGDTECQETTITNSNKSSWTSFFKDLLAYYEKNAQSKEKLFIDQIIAKPCTPELNKTPLDSVKKEITRCISKSLDINTDVEKFLVQNPSEKDTKALFKFIQEKLLEKKVGDLVEVLPTKKVEIESEIETLLKKPSMNIEDQTKLYKLLELQTNMTSKKTDAAAVEPTAITVKGLHNLGNTCFLNAAIQQLFAHPGSAAVQKIDTSTLSPQNKVVNAFCELRKNPGNKTQLEAFRKACINASLIEDNFRQHDTTEAYGQIAVCLGFGKLSVTSTVSYKEDGTNISKQKKETSGLIDLSIDGDDVQDINKAIEKFEGKEELTGDNQFNPGNGKPLVDATKQLKIQAADTLSFSLKRYKYKTDADGKVIAPYIPIKDSKEVAITEKITAGEQEMQLQTVTIHQGSTPGSGHYYMYRRNPDPKEADGADAFLKCNDSVVTPCPLNDVLDDAKENAYMVSYATPLDSALSKMIKEDTFSSLDDKLVFQDQKYNGTPTPTPTQKIIKALAEIEVTCQDESNGRIAIIMDILERNPDLSISILAKQLPKMSNQKPGFKHTCSFFQNLKNDIESLKGKDATQQKSTLNAKKWTKSQLESNLVLINRELDPTGKTAITSNGIKIKENTTTKDKDTIAQELNSLNGQPRLDRIIELHSNDATKQLIEDYLNDVNQPSFHENQQRLERLTPVTTVAVPTVTDVTGVPTANPTTDDPKPPVKIDHPSVAGASYTLDITDVSKHTKESTDFLNAAMKAVHDGIGKQPYPNNDGQGKETQGGKHIYRHNHDGTHALRKVKLAETLFEKIKTSGQPNFQSELSTMPPEEKNVYMLALYMSRTGRVNESGSGTYKADSAAIFRAYATKIGMNTTYIKAAAQMIENMTSKLSADVIAKYNADPKQKALAFIFNWSHNADLIRLTCYGNQNTSKLKADIHKELSLDSTMYEEILGANKHQDIDEMFSHALNFCSKTENFECRDSFDECKRALDDKSEAEKFIENEYITNSKLKETLYLQQQTFQEIERRLKQEPNSKFVFPGKETPGVSPDFTHNLGGDIAKKAWNPTKLCVVMREYIKEQIERLRKTYNKAGKKRIVLGNIGTTGSFKVAKGNELGKHAGKKVYHVWGANKGNNHVRPDGANQAACFKRNVSEEKSYLRRDGCTVGLVTMP